MMSDLESPGLTEVLMDLVCRPGTVKLDVRDGNRVLHLEHSDVVEVQRLATGGFPSPATQNVTVNVSADARAQSEVSFTVVLDQVVTAVRAERPDSVAEAETQCRVLQDESKQAHPSWNRVLGVLKWSMGFGKDVVLPVLVLIGQMRGL